MIVGRDERFRQGLESESGTKCEGILDFFNSKDPECGVSLDTISLSSWFMKEYDVGINPRLAAMIHRQESESDCPKPNIKERLLKVF